jgi:hypothetical protein
VNPPPRCCLWIVPWNWTFRDLALDFLLNEICWVVLNSKLQVLFFPKRQTNFTSASAYTGFQTKMALQKVKLCPDHQTPGRLVPQDASSHAGST